MNYFYKSAFLLVLILFSQHLFSQKPTISSFTPTSGSAGTEVTITGSNLTQVLSVSFGGTPAASFTSINETTIKATIGVGATGELLIFTLYGDVSIPGFTYSVTQPPIISSFTPDRGNVGTTVTITGTNFDAVPSGNIVYFGAVKANVTAAGPNSLTVTVPTGATYQPITVTTNRLTAYSGNFFIPIFTGSDALTANSFTLKSDRLIKDAAQLMSSADMDGDGKPDLVTIGSAVSILKNMGENGDVSFNEAVNYPVGYSPSSVSIGDLNGDGKLDFVITNEGTYDATVSVYKNIGTIGSIAFTGRQNYATGNNAFVGPHSAALGDLDGDGRPDMAIGNDESVAIFRNISVSDSISFAPRINYTGLTPANIAISDLDGDGKPELIVLNSSSSLNTISVFRNTGSNGVISFAPKVDFITGYGSSGVSVSDVDGDGKPDLAFTNSNENTYSVYRNTSTTGSISFEPKVDFPVADYVNTLSIGDINGDGKPDFAISNLSSVSLFKNTSKPGNISFDTLINFPVSGHNTNAIAVGDLNGDGATDFAVTGQAIVAIFVNQLNKSARPAISSFSPNSGNTGDKITIKGSNFTGSTAVSFGNVPATSFTVVSDTVIVATVAKGGSGDVAVITPKGTVSLRGFFFNSSFAIISTFIPVQAGTGTTITIKGINFNGCTAVSFGNVPAASFTVVRDSVITAIVGTGATGNITIRTPHGNDTISGFTFISSSPVIDSFTPASGGTGTTISITGTSLSGAISVSFGGIAASSFTIVSDSVIKAVIGTGASGDVSVTTANGTALLTGFSFTLPPPITNVFKLVQFSGTLIVNRPVLLWRTINEQSTAYYTVEHSIDSSSFSPIGTQKSLSLNPGINTYSLTDSIPRSGLNYYRLKIEDTTGSLTYSNIIAIQSATIPEKLRVYPNPSNSYIIVAVPNITVPSQFKLADMTGSVVNTTQVNPNVSQIKIDLTELQQGVYKLIWSDGKHYSYQTILIVR